MDNRSNEEITYVQTVTVFCDGGKGALGHPGIYLNIGDTRHTVCPYCGHRFELADGNVTGAGH